MLTLEQVRAVNDSLKSGDLNAALRPLEETIDLRSNELPRLDKAAVAALKAGLHNGDDASTWAAAFLHPNISMRRFARKVFMGMGDDAAPLFDPLRQQLERYWSEEKPLGFSSKPQEADSWRLQEEMVESAVELLLRSHPARYVEFYASLVDNKPVDNSWQLAREWQERNEQAFKARDEEVARLLTEEFGSEWAGNEKRYELPTRILNDIQERARQKPEVVALMDAVGDYPGEDEATEWKPVDLVTLMLGRYFSGNTAPMKRSAERMHPTIWQWAQSAFDFESSVDERTRYARRLMESGWWRVVNWLGHERSRSELAPLLLRSKKPLFDALQKYLATDYDEDNEARDGDELLSELWCLMASGLADLFAQASEADSAVEPEMLRQLIADLEPHESREEIVSELEEVATRIEKARRAQNGEVAEVVPEEEKEYETFEEDSPEIMRELGMYEVLTSTQINAIYDAEGYSGRPTWQRIAEAMERVVEEMDYHAEPEKQVNLLVQPSAHPHDPEKIMSRLTYWLMWSRALGDGGREKLKAALWNEAGPKLWARLDGKLEEYRRIETDPVEPAIEKKLTQNELKGLRAQTRRSKREAINAEISDIAKLLSVVEGVAGRRKAIEMADRPSCREVREGMDFAVFYELDQYPGDMRHHVRPAQRTEWELGEEWEWVLRRAEAQLEKAKDEWQWQRLESQLAAGYYRRGQFEKFKDMVDKSGAFPSSVAIAVVVKGDFEAWRVLIGAGERWQSQELTRFWENQQGEPERKARATQAVMHMLSTTSKEDIARRLLDWLASTAPAELEGYLPDLEIALESSLIAVKKWAMEVLSKLPKSAFDRERAAVAADEALWSENLGLAKAAAKFLAQLGIHDAAVAEKAWESLCDATVLENVGVCEAVFRALTQLKAKNDELELSDVAQVRLEVLVGVLAERFGKFEKKLLAVA